MPIIEEKSPRGAMLARREMLREKFFRGGPAPSEPFPNFELPSLQDGMVTKSWLGGRPALITLSSRTDPMTASANRVLKRLHRQFGHDVNFLTIYVSEAHPGDRVPQPASMDEKIAYAHRLKERDDIPWTIAVDGIGGALQRRLGGHTNAAFLLTGSGTVAYRVLWSSDESGLREGIKALMNGDGAFGESQRRFGPWLSRLGAMGEVLKEAGPEARREVRRQNPGLYALSRLAHAFRPLPPRGRGVMALVAGVALTGLAVSGIVAAVRSRRD